MNSTLAIWIVVWYLTRNCSIRLSPDCLFIMTNPPRLVQHSTAIWLHCYFQAKIKLIRLFGQLQGAQKIGTLLQKAKEFIPKEYWARTPLVLKATAGLRLLHPVEAENLLNEVRDVFLRSGFSVKDDAVEIMDGIDEGIFSWFTINFLLSEWNSAWQLAKTIVELELINTCLLSRSFGNKEYRCCIGFGRWQHSSVIHTKGCIQNAIACRTHTHGCNAKRQNWCVHQ